MPPPRMLEPARSTEFAPIVRGPFTLGGDALLALHANHPDRYPFLLESAAAGEPLGRYDILFALPGSRLTLSGCGRVARPDDAEPAARGFLPNLDAWWCGVRGGHLAAGRPLPFLGGWFLYLGYELALEIEPTLDLPRDPVRPVAQAVRIPAAVIRDRRAGAIWIVAEAEVADCLPDIEAELRSAQLEQIGSRSLAVALDEEPEARFLAAVGRALEHVSAGDIYQANLSRGWTGELASHVSAVDVYRRLRATNPGPFAALVALEGRTIVSSSPERLITVRNGSIATRPIAGTRPRGETAAADAALQHELAAHPKERAEHVMLIDLERNDLGRICAPGTVEVNEYMVIESFAHVHHIVSNVRGRLRERVTPGEVIRAVFPGGTITGCPKVRCMDIIGALEGQPRGAYTGSVGYLGHDGSMDLNILIRTIEVTGSRFALRAGAGIVADSVPRLELEETRAKARGLLQALIAEAP